MKIPDSVRIGGVEYAICNNAPSLNDGENLLLGQIRYHENVIMISDLAKGHQSKCITLLHEILHGIRYHAGLAIENEEDVVDMFAKGLYQVLQDNGVRLFDLEEGEKE